MNRIVRLAIATAGVLWGAQIALGQNNVDVTLMDFGVSSAFRPGDVTPIRLQLTSNLTEPTPVWVQWEVPNVDGDIGEFGRSLTLTPNIPALVWLYAALPPDANAASVWTVRVFEERDGVRQGELGGARISPSVVGATITGIDTAMIGVVGQLRMGLDDLVFGQGFQRPFGAHEPTRVVPGISVSQLPDRFYGLKGFEAIAWGGDRDLPKDLTTDQAEAMRQYVFRGGHLIISLPTAGNPWGLGEAGQTLLEELLPARPPAGESSSALIPRLDESVPVSALMPILSKSSLPPRRDVPFSIHVFRDLKISSTDDAAATGAVPATAPATAPATQSAQENDEPFSVIDRENHADIANGYDPLIALPDGRVVVVQRTYGRGFVTVIGLDLASGTLQSLGLPEGDAFWNRILGRRADTLTPVQHSNLKEAGRLASNNVADRKIGDGPVITALINFPGDAMLGLLLAVVIFAIYWLVAGPGGFAVLKYYKKSHQSWLAFAATAAVFTALAWGSVGAMPRKHEVKHVTFLTHIARPPDDKRPLEPQLQHAVSYMAVKLPNYGSTRVAIASDEDRLDVLTSWMPPGEPIQHFPNVDRYVVDVGRSPASFELPSRSTATQLYADWLGALDPKWGGMIRVDPNNPVKVDLTPEGAELQLTGALIHDLPGDLTDVIVIWVKNNRLPRREYQTSGTTQSDAVAVLASGQANNTGLMWKHSGPWLINTPMHLNQLAANPTQMAPGEKIENLGMGLERRYVDDYERNSNMGLAVTSTRGISEEDRRKYFEMLSMFHQIPPPKYLKTTREENDEPSVAFQRELGRELDLSPWFSRPCVIVMGYLRGSECPVPLRLNGDDEPPPSDGLTMVRWIYPLPVEEEIAFRAE